jgi:hypothetical protein
MSDPVDDNENNEKNNEVKILTQKETNNSKENLK